MYLPKILIAEDDVFSANDYRLHLEKNNFQVSLAYNGIETLSQIKTFQPDLLILDMIMPQMDGFSVLQEIKSQIPIIVVSNLDQPSDINKCLQLGAKLFISKSELDYNHLVSTINQILSLQQ